MGNSGSGKSTLARKIAEKLHLPLLHIDQLYWQPNWVATPKDVFIARLEQAVDGEEWVIDGNYLSYKEILRKRFERADIIVFLHFSRTRCFWNVFMRLWKHRGVVRPDIALGLKERIDFEFLKYIWNFPRYSHPRIETAIAQYGAEKKVVRLHNQTEVKDFLTNL